MLLINCKREVQGEKQVRLFSRTCYRSGTNKLNSIKSDQVELPSTNLTVMTDCANNTQKSSCLFLILRNTQNNHTSSLSVRMRSSEEHDQAGAGEPNVNVPFPHLVRSQTGVDPVRLGWL